MGDLFMNNIPSYIQEKRDRFARIQARRAATPPLAAIGVLIGLLMSTAVVVGEWVSWGVPLPFHP